MGCISSTDPDSGTAALTIQTQDEEYEDLPNLYYLKSHESITDLFDIVRELGRGGSCRVLEVIKRSTGEHIAMKELVRDDEWNPLLFRTEITILHKLKHTNVLEYKEAYVGSEHLYMCTVMCKGGELFEQVKKMRHFSEKKAAEVLKVILTAVAHVHSLKMVHRDLKPENIVLTASGRLVLIDFGDCAEIESDTEVFSDFVGTPFYLAPECVRHRNGWELYKSDCWAIGVIAYVLLTGRPPFWGRNNREILLKITTKGVMWPKNTRLSRACKHFILCLLQKDPRKRLSALEALKHPWILREAATRDTHLGNELLENIGNFVNACKLKKLLVRKMVAEMTDEDKRILAQAFKELDENGDGVIDRNELVKYLSNTGLRGEEVQQRADALLQSMDKDGDGFIDLEEWVEGRTAQRLASDANLMKTQFDMLDKDGDGQVSIDEIRKHFDGMLDDEQLTDIIAEIDTDRDGLVSMEEFKRAILAA